MSRCAVHVDWGTGTQTQTRRSVQGYLGVRVLSNDSRDVTVTSKHDRLRQGLALLSSSHAGWPRLTLSAVIRSKTTTHSRVPQSELLKLLKALLLRLRVLPLGQL